MEINGTTMEEIRTMEAIQSINHKIPELTLRDLFAMNALNAIINCHTNGNIADIFDEFEYYKPIETKDGNTEQSDEKHTSRDWIVKASYLVADAMLKARKRS